MNTTTTASLLGRGLLFAAIVALSGAATAQAAGRWATLEAIHVLENPNNSPKPGPYGELGAYQFRLSTWQLHTKVPFARALDRQESDAVAVMHYDYLKRGLERNGVPATPYTIALAWNGGLDAAVKGSSPRVAHEYARRAVNLAEEMEMRAVATEARAPVAMKARATVVANDGEPPVLVAQPKARIEPGQMVAPTLTTSEVVVHYVDPRRAALVAVREEKNAEIAPAMPVLPSFNFSF